MKHKVLLTTNPLIIEGNRFSTMRRLVRLLDACCDLLLVPADGYDFKRRKVRAYRRNRDGTFARLSLIEPRADLWIVYSDGFYLDHRAFGFKLRRDYFKAQLDFHREQLQAGRVRVLVNSPDAEANTLKSWLATLDFQKYSVIPTYVFSEMSEVYDFQRAQEGPIVAKLNWGGASTGVEKLRNEKAVRDFHSRLAQSADADLSDYSFQLYCRGDEKRFWFAGGKLLGARVIRGRETPWSGDAWNFRVRAYDHKSSASFARDQSAAQRLCDLSGISVGAVDFIGDKINEVNGGGTVLTTYEHNKLIIDHRPAFLDYVLSLLNSL
jgi:hypothetical protein